MLSPFAFALFGNFCLLTPNFTAPQIAALPRQELKSCLPPVRRPDYTYVEGIGAYKLHTTAGIWQTARRTCIAEGGQLLVVNSDAEAEAVKALWVGKESHKGSANSFYAHCGFHELHSKGDYVTVHGDPLNKTGWLKWGPGEPSIVNENCGSITKAGFYNDIDCFGMYGFICEQPWEYVSFPTGA
ncbi:hemolymph lipopolysaccharide-binding protein-like [Athalia rosae]|uniref:hemolymph lipopolysaccharide-binding protein-like n=1 Tax=Athalia rosae TaxID=37344 RepID=UPI0020340B7F|nr:hemolymph lipopolysaccharide-binding protein-like [Athalia rosae]